MRTNKTIIKILMILLVSVIFSQIGLSFNFNCTSDSVLTEFSGSDTVNWIIENDTICENVYIELSRNITISTNGRLEFRNVTLDMNVLGNDGNIGIEVEPNSNGIFIYDSRIQSMTANNYFWIVNQSFIMDRTNVSNCGYAIPSNNPGINLFYGNSKINNSKINEGFINLYINSENNTIENTQISDSNYYPIFFATSNNKIINSNITNGTRGIYFDSNVNNITINKIIIKDISSSAYYLEFTNNDQILINNSIINITSINHGIYDSANTLKLTIINSKIDNNFDKKSITIDNEFSNIKIYNSTIDKNKITITGTQANITFKEYVNFHVNGSDGADYLNDVVVKLYDNSTNSYGPTANYTLTTGTPYDPGYTAMLTVIDMIMYNGYNTSYSPYNVTFNKTGYKFYWNNSYFFNKSETHYVTLDPITPLTCEGLFSDNGNVIITEDLTCENLTIIAQNVTVNNSARLILKNTTLIINETAIGHPSIINITNEAAGIELQNSTIKGLNDNDYDFISYSNTLINHSLIKDVGSSTTINGLHIYTNNAIIINSRFENNYEDLVLKGDNFTLENLELINSYNNGIRIGADSFNPLTNSKFKNISINSSGKGIIIQDNSNNHYFEKLFITNDEIDTGEVLISLNKAYNLTFNDSIFNISQSTGSSAFSIDFNSANFTLINSKIYNLGESATEIKLIGNSFINIINSSFDRSKIEYVSFTGNISFYEYIKFKIYNDSVYTEALFDVNLTLKDNISKNEKYNLTTDESGYTNTILVLDGVGNSSYDGVHYNYAYSPYNITFEKEGYITKNLTFYLNESTTFEANISMIAEPSSDYILVELINPITISENKTPTVTFKVNGSMTGYFNCSLRTNITGHDYEYNESVVNNTPTSLTFATDLPTGSHKYWVNCSNNEINNVSNNITLLIVEENPSINLLSPKNNNVTTNTSQIFTFNFTDTYSSTANCSLIINGSIYRYNSTVLNNTPTDINQELSIGNYNWTINCTDIYGNIGSDDGRNLTIEALDQTGPTPITYSPTTGTSREYDKYRQDYFNVTWTDISGIENVRIYNNFSNGIWNNYEVSNISNSYYYNTTNIKPGRYAWYMNASDTEGNSNWTGYIDYIITKSTNDQLILTINGTESSTPFLQRKTSLWINGSSNNQDIGLTLFVDYENLSYGINVSNFYFFNESGLKIVNLTMDANDRFEITNKVLTVQVNDTIPPAKINNLQATHITYDMINWTWTLPSGEDDINKAEVWIDGELVENITNPYGQTYFDYSTTQNTLVNISVRLVDDYNNTGEEFNTSNRTLRINYAPTTYLEKPDNNTQINNSLSVTFNFTAYDELPIYLNCSLKVMDNIDSNITIFNLSAYSGTPRIYTNSSIFSYNHSYSWSVNCTDGEYYNISDTYYFNIADTLPPAKINNLTNLTGDSWIYITWYNPSTDFNHTEVWFNDSYYDTFNDTYQTLNITGLDDNTIYNFNITAYDIYNNGNTTLFNITTEVGDYSAPYINYPQMPESGTITNNESVIFNITASDDSGGTISCNLTIYNSSSTMIESQTLNILSGTYGSTTVNLPDGEYHWNFTCVDYDSNQANSTTYLLTVDTTPPFYSDLWNNTDGGSTFNESYDYLFKIRWNDTITEITNVWFENNLTNNPLVNSTPSQNGNLYTYSPSTPLKPGTYAYKWYARDNANNFNNTELFTFTINKAEPALMLKLDGSEQNITYLERKDNVTVYAMITKPSTETITVTLQNSSGTFSIDQYTTLQFNEVGISNITASFEGNENYTSKNITYYVNVSDNVGPEDVVIDQTVITTSYFFIQWNDSTSDDFNHTEVLIDNINYDHGADTFINLNTPSETEYEVLIRHFDIYGNNGSWTNITITTLSNIPSIELLYPTDYLLISNMKSVNLTFNVTDESDYVNCTAYIYGRTNTSFSKTYNNLYTQVGTPYTFNTGEILEYNNTYNWSVNCSDPYNYSVSNTQAFGIIDTNPPIISNINIYNITDSSAIINWTTNEPSNYSIELKDIPRIDFSTLDTTHARLIEGLSPSTYYDINITACDLYNNCIKDDSKNLTTTNFVYDISVSLINPIADAWIPYNNNITFNFSVNGNVEIMSCNLSIDDNRSEYFNKINTTIENYSTTFYNLEFKYHNWSVTCNHSDNVWSDIRYFNLTNDYDNDTYNIGTGTNEDCDDTNPNIHPGVADNTDDNIDNDCDGDIDEDYSPPSSSGGGSVSLPPEEEIIEEEPKNETVEEIINETIEITEEIPGIINETNETSVWDFINESINLFNETDIPEEINETVEEIKNETIEEIINETIVIENDDNSTDTDDELVEKNESIFELPSKLDLETPKKEAETPDEKKEKSTSSGITGITDRIGVKKEYYHKENNTVINFTIKNKGIVPYKKLGIFINIPKFIAESTDKMIGNFYIIRKDPQIAYVFTNFSGKTSKTIEFQIKDRLLSDEEIEKITYYTNSEISKEYVDSLKKKANETYDAIKIKKEIIQYDDKTEFTIELEPINETENVTLYLDIPKCLAEKIEEIEFELEDYEILDDDPLIAFNFATLTDTKTLNFEVLKAIDPDCWELVKTTPIAEKIKDKIIVKDEKSMFFSIGILLFVLLSTLSFNYLQMQSKKKHGKGILEKLEFGMVEIILILIITLNIMDFFKLLNPDLDFAKKILSWSLLGILLYEARLEKIFYGTERRFETLLLIIANFFMFSRVFVDVVFVLYNEIVEKRLDSYVIHLYQFVIDFELSHPGLIVSIGSIIGFSMLIILSFLDVFKNVKKPSLLEVLHVDGKPKGIGQGIKRFLISMMLYLTFFIVFFNFFMEWLAISVDAALMVVAIVVYGIRFIVKQYHHYHEDHIINKIGNIGEEFYEQFINLFKYKHTVFFGLAGILVLHLIVDIGNFIMPFIFNFEDMMYFIQSGVPHLSLLHILMNLYSQDILANIVITLNYLLNISFIIMILIFPAYIWYDTYKNHIINFRRWIVAFFYIAVSNYLISPLVKLSSISNADILGVDLIFKSSVTGDPLMTLLISIGVGIVAFILSYNLILKTVIKLIGFIPVLIFIMIYVTYYVNSWISNLFPQIVAAVASATLINLFLGILMSFFMTAIVIFYIGSFIYFIKLIYTQWFVKKYAFAHLAKKYKDVIKEHCKTDQDKQVIYKAIKYIEYMRKREVSDLEIEETLANKGMKEEVIKDIIYL
ncbi:hypothetical protein C0585_03275 [Candidatus Woesearchaeota archaeon]|nr:MAG: hypothetical protein C0585_03275 [Candidatus Woesearchaeota archaeon]